MNILNSTKESVNSMPITVAYGDGIGPEIMEATLDILRHAGAKLKIETAEIGEAYYYKGYSSGISDEAFATIKKNKVFLKSPITTPQGGGYKSLNVTIRRALGLYANVRPCMDFDPFVPCKHKINMVIVRENEEDLYSGMEYRQTHNSVHAIKTITRTGCQKIVRYAFEYAVKNSRKKVTCMTKDNIMKMTDGLFHTVFNEIAAEYPQIETEHYIIDIGSARLATVPDHFDVVVTLNLYGDVISDIVAEMTGSVGLAGSSNIGVDYAMFEAIHGSAPMLIGQNRANPSGLLNAAIMMLVHIGQGWVANRVQNALLYTLEAGYHTPDIAKHNPTTVEQLGTKEFAAKVIENLGKIPSELPVAPHYPDFDFGDGYVEQKDFVVANIDSKADRKLVGVDIFANFIGNGDEFSKLAIQIANDKFKLHVISFNGMKIYPNGNAGQFAGDTWRCRFMANETVQNADIIELLKSVASANIDCIKTENLYSFDGKNDFTLSQGE